MSVDICIQDSHLIFGYGSLVDILQLEEFLGRTLAPADYSYSYLQGYERCWNVAMDNSLNQKNYKYYLDSTGKRPDIFVTFLNIQPSKTKRASTVNGIVFRVSSKEFEEIKLRERNYTLEDISAQLSSSFHERVYASVAKPEAIERFDEAAAKGKAVIHRAYKENVEAAFRSVSEGFLKDYFNSTLALLLPCIDLERVNT